jgi:hypothetical protein
MSFPRYCVEHFVSCGLSANSLGGLQQRLLETPFLDKIRGLYQSILNSN